MLKDTNSLDGAHKVSEFQIQIMIAPKDAIALVPFSDNILGPTTQ